MGRQRCLLQNILHPEEPDRRADQLPGVAAATTNSVSTNIPQAVLPALVTLAGEWSTLTLESVSFDPNLPDPEEPNGRFNTGHPDFPYMRQVVQDAIDRRPGRGRAGPPTPRPAEPRPTTGRAGPASLPRGPPRCRPRSRPARA